MKKLTFAYALMTVLLINLAHAAAFKTLKIDDVAKLMEQKQTKVTILDANGDKTRKEMGVVPGAILLDSSSKYDVTKFLPSDKATKLVFYCGNQMCTASHAAAKRATASGYTDVNVMADGIMGWVKAGKPVTKM